MGENLLLYNDKPLKTGISQLIIKTDASKTGWGNSVISRKKKAYQFTGIVALAREKISDSFVLLDKSGEYSPSQTVASSQRDLGLPVSQSNGCDSRVHAKQPECLSKLESKHQKDSNKWKLNP